MEVISSNTGLYFSQPKCCLEMLHQFGKLSCKPLITPLDLNAALKSNGIDNNDGFMSDIAKYQTLIHNLIYLKISIPDAFICCLNIKLVMHSPQK